MSAIAVDFAPEFAPSRPPSALIPAVNNMALYEAGSTGTRRTLGWNAPTTSANQGVLSNLTTLRGRSRSATRNDGFAKGVIDNLVSEIIGTGIKPQSQGPLDYKVPHPITGQLVPFRHALQALWALSVLEMDADGLNDHYGQQGQVARGWLEGGEVFGRLRYRRKEDGLRVPIQVQVIEPELCPHTHTVYGAQTRIRAGIEFNAIGQRVRYWFHPSRPDFDDDFDQSQLKAIDAANVQHVYEPIRPGQLRGIPHLTQALISLYELDKYDDATLLRQQLSNLFVGFIKTTNPADINTVHPLTNATVPKVGDKPTLKFQPGVINEMRAGESMEWSNPPGPNGYDAFMRQQLLGVAAATGVPYEVLTGDMRGVSDRTMRILLNLFRRRIQAYQHERIVFMFCQPVWDAWVHRVFLSGALPIPIEYVENPDKWRAVKWSPQAWPYMHPVQDVQAQKAAVRAGFTSRTAVVGEQGEDAEVIDAEQAADNDRADKSGVKYDSDGRNPDKGGKSASKSSPADDDDFEKDDPPEPPQYPQPSHEGVR